MKTYKQIASILLLTLFSWVIFHNAIPHFHYKLDGNAKISKISNHHHDHHHHGTHHHHADSNSNWIDLLLGLLGDFDHTDLGEGHFDKFIAKNENFIFCDSNINSHFQIAEILLINDSSIESKSKVKFLEHSPPILLWNYFHSDPDRGPPSIS